MVGWMLWVSIANHAHRCSVQQPDPPSLVPFLTLPHADALLSCDQQFIELSTLLPRFPDLDALLSNFAYMPRVRTPTTARQCIGAAIALKHTLAQIPAVAQALAAGPAQGSLLMERILESLQVRYTRTLHTLR